MRIETITYTVHHRVFDPGDHVRIRETGETAVVERFARAAYMGDEGTVFLAGHRRGFSPNECEPVLDPHVPVIRVIAVSSIVPRVDLPSGERFHSDTSFRWRPDGAGYQLAVYDGIASAVADAIGFLLSRGFATFQLGSV
jgi:hypothetical protein